MSDPLSAHLKQLIVETLRLEYVNPEDIQDNVPLIGSGLSLDSIDAVELVRNIGEVAEVLRAVARNAEASAGVRCDAVDHADTVRGLRVSPVGVSVCDAFAATLIATEPTACLP